MVVSTATSSSASANQPDPASAPATDAVTSPMPASNSDGASHARHRRRRSTRSTPDTMLASRATPPATSVIATGVALVPWARGQPAEARTTAAISRRPGASKRRAAIAVGSAATARASATIWPSGDGSTSGADSATPA